MNIPKEQIDNLLSINSKNTEWANNHYDEDIYESIEVLGNSDNILIKTIFSYKGWDANTRILFDSKHNIESHSCNCNFHSHNKPCGHVLALLLFIKNYNFEAKLGIYSNEDIQIILFGPKYNIPNVDLEPGLGFLRSIQSEIGIQTSQINIQEKYRLSIVFTQDQDYMRSFIMKLKISSGEISYYIKDIASFINGINDRKLMKFGKKLEVRLSKMIFDKDSQLLLNKVIMPCFEYIINNTDNYYGSYFRYYPERSLKVFDDIYDILFNNIDLVNECSNFTLIKQTEPIDFNIDDGDDEVYYLDVDLPENCFIASNGLYHFNMTNEEIIRITSLNDQTRIFFESFNWEYQFNKDGIRQLISILEESLNIKWHGADIKELIVEDDKEVSMYGDIVEGDIQVKLIERDKSTDNEVNILQRNNITKLSLNAIRASQIIYSAADWTDLDEGIAFFEIDNDNTIDFFTNGINRMQEYCDILVTDSLKNIHYSSKLGINVGIKIENDLLHINISSIDCSKEELLDILKEYKKKKKYYKLKNGEIINIQNSDLNDVIQLSDGLDISENQLLDVDNKIPLYRAFYTKDKINSLTSLNFDISDSFNNFIDNFNELKINELQVNSKYQDTLHSYQITGVKWLMLLA